jgi:CubicO group peptidase (beta-lactamase class C family)/imidazolonepropionase-like amidohydrolase
MYGHLVVGPVLLALEECVQCPKETEAMMHKASIARAARVASREARVLLIAAMILLPAFPLHGQNAEVPRTRTLPETDSPAFPYARAEEVGLSSEKLNRIGDEIAAWVANGDLVGAELLIIRNGRAVFHEAYGWADRERQEPVARNSIWSLKSMAKPVTATAVLMLAEEGKLSLDDPVTRYIPGFAGDPRATVRHLLAHTSGDEGGPGGGGYDVYFFDSLREWVADGAGKEPRGEFGAFRYSNFNYAALGYIVEAVAGEPLETFTEKRILGPLGMRETFTAFTPEAPWAPRVNSRYRWDEEARQYERYWSNRDLEPWTFYPAGFGLWGTAMDYARFVAMWLNQGEHDGGRLLTGQTVAKALDPHEFGPQGVYGYGWYVQPSHRAGAGPLAFQHDGADGTVAVAFPADDALVVYLSHSQGGSHLIALQDRLAALGVFDYPGPLMVVADERDVVEVALSSQERGAYTGTYRGKAPWSEAGVDMVVRVWEQDGRLHGSVGQPGSLADRPTHLVPLGAHQFAMGRYHGARLAAVDPHATLRVVLEDDQASTVQLVMGGQVLFSAARVDPGTLLAESEAERSRVSIADIVADLLDAEGIDAARARYRALRSARPDSVRFAASLLDGLGHRLLHRDRIAEAIAVFQMNVEAYPDSPISHGGLGDAYVASGRVAEARSSYERAIELALEKEPMLLRTYRERLERQMLGSALLAQEPALPLVALTNVTVIDGRGNAAPGMTVLIEGERIRSVLPAGEWAVPADARQIDLAGHYVIPGLVESHFHATMLVARRGRAAVEPELRRHLYAGVTTIRDMAGDWRLQAAVEREIQLGHMLGPDVYYAAVLGGPAFEQFTPPGALPPPEMWPNRPPLGEVVTREMDIPATVTRMVSRGASALKLYLHIEAETVRALMAEARRNGLQVWAHGTVFPDRPIELVRAGVDGLSHVCWLAYQADGLDPSTNVPFVHTAFPPAFDAEAVNADGPEFLALFDEMAERGVVLDATYSLYTEGQQSFWGCTPELVTTLMRAAHRAGVPIATGTDSYADPDEPWPMVFREIEALVNHGILSPMEAIVAATYNGALAAGIADRYGSIEPGKAASLVVLREDPSKDVGALRSVVSVFKRGIEYPRSDF